MPHATSNNVCIFTGPTIAPEDARLILEATYLPPAAQGDVYRAAKQLPAIIGIVDGYFHRVPSVWHKEILWAMSQGIHVFGSSSIGALRAAELHAFGMIGVGQIFADYASDRIFDDDEVAVIHGPPELGYVALSEPMTNIRATLAAATEQSIISSETFRTLSTLAKDIFFPERTYQQLLARAVEHRIPSSELAALRDWLPLGKIDQKRIDAIEMLTAIGDLAGQPDLQKKEVQYHLEKTYMFDAE